MPTDDERRAVARRLRETGEELGSAALLWYHIAKALGVRTATDGKTACGMLAELIEPSGYGCVPGECPLNVRRDNDRIDRDALLALAGCVRKMGEDYDKLSAFGLGTTFRAIADRIREALGVE